MLQAVGELAKHVKLQKREIELILGGSLEASVEEEHGGVVIAYGVLEHAIIQIERHLIDGEPELSDEIMSNGIEAFSHLMFAELCAALDEGDAELERDDAHLMLAAEVIGSAEE